MSGTRIDQSNVIRVCHSHPKSEIEEHIGSIAPIRRTDYRDACELCPYLNDQYRAQQHAADEYGPDEA